MDRTDDIVVASAAAAGTLVLVAVGELLSVGGSLIRAVPLSVYFAYAVVHDPERGDWDRVRTWVGLAALLTLVTLVWLLL